MGFPCPNCRPKLRVPDLYVLSIPAGFAALPALILTALGLSWQRIVIGVLIAFFPVFYFGIKFLKYIIPPKVEPYLPQETTLNLRGGPRP
jgi:hypothetical protein